MGTAQTWRFYKERNEIEFKTKNEKIKHEIQYLREKSNETEKGNNQ